MILIRITILLLLLSNVSYAACDCGSADAANPCTGNTITIAVNGTIGTGTNSNFTWSFNSGGGDATCGKFANGDYWVAPANGQTTVTITGISTTYPGGISADTDPVMESIGLLNGENSYGNYNESENIIPRLPVSYSGINSILAVTKKDESSARVYDGDSAACTSNKYTWNKNTSKCGTCGTVATVGECANSYNVLTIMPGVPLLAGSTMIRPNITGQTKKILTWADFDLSRIVGRDFISSVTPSRFEEIRQRWAHNTEIIGLKTSVKWNGYSEGGRAFRASSIVDDYGAGMATALVSDIVATMSIANTLEEKKPAIAAILSFGLDLYMSVFNGPEDYDRFWGTGASQSPGKFTAPAFLAALLTDDSYLQNMSGESSHLSEYASMHGPHEIGQIQWGSNEKPLWGDLQYSGTADISAYWGGLFKYQNYDGATGAKVMPSSKNHHDPHGYIDGPPMAPDTSYMTSTLGGQWGWYALSKLLPRFSDAVNYPKLLTYVEQIEDYGVRSASDPCVTPDTRESIACAPYPNGSNCLYYGVTWGPVIKNSVGADCIKVPTPPFTQVGRFLRLNGTSVSPSTAYTSGRVIDMWPILRAMPTISNVKLGSLSSTGTGALKSGTGKWSN